MDIGTNIFGMPIAQDVIDSSFTGEIAFLCCQLVNCMPLAGG